MAADQEHPVRQPGALPRPRLHGDSVSLVALGQEDLDFCYVLAMDCPGNWPRMYQCPPDPIHLAVALWQGVVASFVIQRKVPVGDPRQPVGIASIMGLDLNGHGVADFEVIGHPLMSRDEELEEAAELLVGYATMAFNVRKLCQVRFNNGPGRLRHLVTEEITLGNRVVINGEPVEVMKAVIDVGDFGTTYCAGTAKPVFSGLHIKVCLRPIRPSDSQPLRNIEYSEGNLLRYSQGKVLPPWEMDQRRMYNALSVQVVHLAGEPKRPIGLVVAYKGSEQGPCKIAEMGVVMAEEYHHSTAGMIAMGMFIDELFQSNPALVQLTAGANGANFKQFQRLLTWGVATDQILSDMLMFGGQAFDSHFLTFTRQAWIENGAPRLQHILAWQSRKEPVKEEDQNAVQVFA